MAKNGRTDSHARAADERRLALLICNGTFPKTGGFHIAGAIADARVLEQTLADPETCRFEVRALVDKGLLAVRREIARACRDVGERDTLLIHYSGNGTLHSTGELHLMVRDSDPEFPSATMLDTEFVLSQLRGSACRRIVLLVDACHAGAFFVHNRGIPNGLYAITACDAQELSFDTPEGGPFTLALCEGLRNAQADLDGDGFVSIDELHDFIKRRLVSSKHVGAPQKWVWNVPEPIYLASSPPRVFLSYAREDAASVDALAVALQREGLNVWVDRSKVHAGAWKEHVTQELNRCRAMVVLLTEHSLASGAVERELDFARKKGVPIIPAAFGEVTVDELPDWFTFEYEHLHRHRLDPAALATGAKQLAAAVRRSHTAPSAKAERRRT
jgi:hypothetical protein